MSSWSLHRRQPWRRPSPDPTARPGMTRILCAPATAGSGLVCRLHWPGYILLDIAALVSSVPAPSLTQPCQPTADLVLMHTSRYCSLENPNNSHRDPPALVFALGASAAA